MNQTVSVYYDETYLKQEKCHGHVLFFVPDKIETIYESPLFGKTTNNYYPKQDLLKKISSCRGEKYSNHKFHFSKLSGKKWSEIDALTSNMMNILVDGLRSKGSFFFKPPLSCKVAILYYPNSSGIDMYGGITEKEKKQRFCETMLRILIKGSCHFLYDEDHKIIISRIIVDGRPGHREFDEGRIVYQLFAETEINRTPLRDYVKFGPEIKITHLDSNHTNYETGTIEYEDANNLQCADLLLGAFNYAIYSPPWNGPKHFNIKDNCDNKKSFLSKPVADMIHKIDRESGFQNSGHYLSFTVSKVVFEGKDVIFQNVAELTARDGSQFSGQSEDSLFDLPNT